MLRAGGNDGFALRIIQIFFLIFRKISEELNMTESLCKEHFVTAISRYKEAKDSPDSPDSKHNQLIAQLGVDVDFEFCLENFSNLCRFCFRLKSDDLPVREIFDDSTDELQSKSNDLIEKIHYTLYDNVRVSISALRTIHTNSISGS